MCRDTIRAASRSITACSGPNCGSSAGCTGSPPPSAGRESAPDGETASWTIETKGEDWQTRTHYDFLRTEDFIQNDLAWPIWRTVFHAVIIYWRLVFGGTIARFWKAHWRFATFITYPHFLLFNEALFSAAIAFVFGWGLEALGIPGFLSIAAAVALFVAVLGTMLKYTENLTYLLYLLSDTIWTWEFSHRQRPEWDQRIDRFAQHLVNVASTSDAEEIVIVGHSSGSFLGRRDAGARAQTRSRSRPPRPAHRAADHRRQLPDRRVSRRLARFPRSSAPAGDRALDRLDRLPVAQGCDELLSVRSDRRPRHRCRRRQAQSRPSCPVRFREIIKPEHYNRFRWKFFRVHFQFVMANERPHAYDFFMIVCGPVPLKERMADQAAALAIATGDTGAREMGWNRLETAPIAGLDASETGRMEPTVARRG